jgi:calcineurin-like phosphoesterase family protein
MFDLNYKVKDLSNTYFTSDIHAWHVNLTRGVSKWSDLSGCRDFDDEDEMTDVIISNINEKVPRNATLIHLGDWSFRGRQNIRRLRDMINCETVVNILGNHDHHIMTNSEYQRCFDWVGHYLELRYRKRLFCISHYPMESWNEIGKGSIMLHGHQHHSGTIVRANRLDVGIDGPDYDYTPLHIDEIFDYLPNVDVEFVDHHTDKTNYD